MTNNNKKTLSNEELEKSMDENNINDFIHGSDDKKINSDKDKQKEYSWEDLDPNENRSVKNGKNITLNSYEKSIIDAGARKKMMKPVPYMRYVAMKYSKEFLGIDN